MKKRNSIGIVLLVLVILSVGINDCSNAQGTPVQIEPLGITEDITAIIGIPKGRVIPDSPAAEKKFDSKA